MIPDPLSVDLRLSVVVDVDVIDQADDAVVDLLDYFVYICCIVIRIECNIDVAGLLIKGYGSGVVS